MLALCYPVLEPRRVDKTKKALFLKALFLKAFFVRILISASLRRVLQPS